MSDIVERFARIHRDEPDRLLVHVPAAATSFTADDLWRTSRACRDVLAAHGISPDHLVLLACGNRASTLTIWLACRALDAVVMPVDPGTPASEMRALAERFGATTAIVAATPAHVDRLGTATPLDGLLDANLAIVRIDGVEPAPQIYRGAAALKLTSGSSGVPKATFTREAHLVADTTRIVEAMDIRPGHCQLAIIPLAHSYGIGNLAMPVLLQGTSIVLRDTFVPQLVAADAARYGARVFPGVPFMFAHFANNPGAIPWPKGLDMLMSAGAPLDAATARAFARAFGVKVHSFYGASESGGISYDDSPDLEASETVGRPLPGVTVTLHPDDGAPHEGGRVHVASGAVASGYAGHAPSPDDFVAGGFLTGDYGRFTAAGNLVLTGRVSSFINVAGRKIQPEEVEQVLRLLPDVVDVRVVGLPDPARGQQIVACLVARAAPLAAAAVRAHCVARLAEYKVPRTILWLEGIPLTERGKTDRAKLEALVRDRWARIAENVVL